MYSSTVQTDGLRWLGVDRYNKKCPFTARDCPSPAQPEEPAPRLQSSGADTEARGPSLSIQAAASSVIVALISFPYRREDRLVWHSIRLHVADLVDGSKFASRGCTDQLGDEVNFSQLKQTVTAVIAGTQRALYDLARRAMQTAGRRPVLRPTQSQSSSAPDPENSHSRTPARSGSAPKLIAQAKSLISRKRTGPWLGLARLHDLQPS